MDFRRVLFRSSSVTTSAEKILLDLAAHNAKEISPGLPMRSHSFTRAIPGLCTCFNPGCTGGTRPDGWPFGPVLFDQKDSCPHGQSLVFEIQSCPDCGEPFLPADDLGDRVLPRRSDQDTDEFRENSYRARDHEDEEEIETASRREKEWQEG